MKKVILFIPPKSDSKDIKQIGSQFPRIGTAYIAAYLRQNGYDVKIVDAIALNLNAEGIKKIIKKEKPDFIGLGPFTEEIYEAYKVCKIAKQVDTGIVTVLGGPHASALPRETLEEFPLVDCVIYGEGEETFLKLANGLALVDIDGIAYRKNDEIIVNKPACPIENLDEIPYPAWDLYPMDSYRGILTKNFNRKMDIPALELPVLSVRGCPSKCNFCYKVYDGVRFRDPVKVVDEIEFLVDKYGATDIFFAEGTFLAKSEHGKKICTELIRRRLGKKISWVAETRVNAVDEESLKLMKEAGCEELYYGIESGDEEILKKSKKGITFDQMRTAIKLTRKVGIRACCFSIIGHPNETKETIDKTINLLMELDADIMNIAIMLPFPGTKIRELAEKGEGNYRLLSNDWAIYTKQQGGPLELVNLPLRELQRMQSRGYIRYFLRPKKLPYILSHFTPRKIFEIVSDLLKKAFS